MRTLATFPSPKTSSDHFDMKPPTTTSSHSSGSQYQANNNTQWGQQETVELINVRGQLETNFSTSKRNRALWESVASSLKQKGFFRTPHQCKSKWKNLVNRYKGKETSDPVNGKQCPFFEELHAVFSERSRNSQQSFVESQQVATQSRKRMKSYSGDQFSDDVSQDDDDEGDDCYQDGLIRSSSAQKRKTDREEHVSAGLMCSNSIYISSSSSIQEMLRGFFQQQQRIEIEWRESMERHQRERELFEHESRHSMEKLERERLMLEQAWMEREEQRKIREEVRAEKRDSLLTSLLNKLISQENL